jgi:hypothetical protein
VSRAITERPETAVRHTESRSSSSGHTGHTRLSREADAFLRHAAHPGNETLTLEYHWTALKITSGSTKYRTLDELRGRGFIRLERRGKAQAVHLYDTAWDYLGLRPPRVHGRGGPLHRQLADTLARHFKRQGYDVRVECEIGPRRKRVDLIAFSRGKRIGVEIALTDVDQELRNLKEDLDSGALDIVLIVSVMEPILQRIKARAASDPALASRLGQVHFHLMEPEDLER